MDSLLTFEGTVVKGKGRGKKLGFPTANFPADKSTPQGTYYSQTQIEGKFYNSITFIGTVDTFNETDFNCETYILDFSEEIYGKEITVHIIEKIRDNKKFDTEEELIKQIEDDKKKAEEFFKNN